jgi:hypothetical protein
MANSKGRRKLRRQLQEAGLGHLLQSAPPSPQSSGLSSGKGNDPPRRRFSVSGILGKIPAASWVILVFLATAMTLLEGYPWLSVSRGATLDPANPLSLMFDVKNEGYSPAESLDADCTFWFEMIGTGMSGHASDVTTPFPNFADTLYHSGTATLPCFRSIGLSRNALPLASADVRVKVSYFVWPFFCSFCKRHQTFRFKGAVSGDLPMQWSLVN